MKQQIQMSSWANGHPPQAEEPIFFFDGGFRTMGQAERRAKLNSAIASHVARNPMR